jgi:hypothetical protein
MSALFLTSSLMPAGCWARHRDCNPIEAITPCNPPVQRCPASDKGTLCFAGIEP